MKKSLLALFLAIVMSLSVFCTSCSSKDEGDDTKVMETNSETEALTITLYAPTKSTTTQKEIDVVQEAFNNITQSKFNTNVVLKLIPEDEYDSSIESLLDNIHKQKQAEEEAEQSRAEAEREALLRGETLPEETTEEKTDDQSSTPQEKYPAVKENQLDIFLVHSFETYYKLAVAEDLSPLDKEISASSKILNSYIYPYLLRSAKIEGSTYGIFNNTVFGDYEYLLLNKELVDKYEYDPENMKDLDSIYMFLQEVKQNEPSVIPFLGEFDAPVVYWNDTESLIGTFVGSSFLSSGTVDATTYLPDPLYPGNILNLSAFREWATKYNELYQAGCIVEETSDNANSKYAAKIIKGDVTMSPTFASTYGKYKTDGFGFKYYTDEQTGVDYYVSVYKRPVADNNNVFNAGYVISAYTENVSRCMQIITALNTDATLSNIFMYGVQDVHYKLDETTNVVHKLTDSYAMDIETIGNIYLLNPSDDMNDYWKFMSDNGWRNAKNTNREAVMSPFLAFYFNPDIPRSEDLSETQVMINKSFKDVYAEIVEISKPYLAGLKSFRDSNGENFDTYIKKMRTDTNSEAMIAALTDYQKGIYYMLSTYNDWYQEHYNVKFSNEE